MRTHFDMDVKPKVAWRPVSWFLLLLYRHREVENTVHNTQELVTGPVRVQFIPYIGPAYRGRCESAVCVKHTVPCSWQLDVGTALYSRKKIHTKGIYNSSGDTVESCRVFFPPSPNNCSDVTIKGGKNYYHNCTGVALKYSDWSKKKKKMCGMFQSCIYTNVASRPEPLLEWVYRGKLWWCFQFQCGTEKNRNTYIKTKP